MELNRWHIEGNSSDPEPHRPNRHRSGSHNHPIFATKPVRRSRRIQQRQNYQISSIPEAEHEDADRSATDVKDKCLSNPPLPVSPSLREIRDAAEPAFVDFVCQWKGCPAVLNNLSRLKKHIEVVHGHEAARSLQCRWSACGQVDEGDLATPASFGTIEELKKHVDTLHMRSVMWRLGDGPKGGPQLGVVSGSTDHPPGYLFCNGEQVSPWVKDQQIETAADSRRRKRRPEEFRASLHTQ